jgi:hypothetical protein
VPCQGIPNGLLPVYSALMIAQDVVRLRMHNQRLAGAPFARPEEVVRWSGAVQAQDYGGAKWGIAQRTAGVTSTEIDRLFAQGAILRTHILRPTWHFVMPEDIRWMQVLTGPRVHALNAHYYRKLELDGAMFRRSEALLTKTLRGGNRLTRAELAGVYRDSGIDASALRMTYLLMHAELETVICSGALRGKQFTYALLEEQAPRSRTLDRDEALAELTIRYFACHGPATVHDFAWWSSLTVADVKAGIEMAKSQLVSDVVGETTYWFAPTGPAGRLESPVAHLLPNFDEYLVAYKDHSASFDAEVYGRLKPEEAPLMAHILVVDGLVVGGWKRTIGRREVTIRTNLLVPLGGAEWDAVRMAAAGYGRFLGLPVRFDDDVSM